MRALTVCSLSLELRKLTREEKVEQRNKAYYAKFPEDVDRIQLIVTHLSTNEVLSPPGRITPQRFQQLGILFGMHGKQYSQD